MRRRSFGLLGVMVISTLILICCLVACAPASPPPTPTVDPLVVNRAKVASNLMAQITVAPDPNPPIAGQNVRLTIRITDGEGQPSNGLSVEVKVSPPTGTAKDSTLPAKPGTNGEYVATFNPNVPGTWGITVTARAGGFIRTSSTNLEVK